MKLQLTQRTNELREEQRSHRDLEATASARLVRIDELTQLLQGKDSTITYLKGVTDSLVAEAEQKTQHLNQKDHQILQLRDELANSAAHESQADHRNQIKTLEQQNLLSVLGEEREVKETTSVINGKFQNEMDKELLLEHRTAESDNCVAVAIDEIEVPALSAILPNSSTLESADKEFNPNSFIEMEREVEAPLPSRDFAKKTKSSRKGIRRICKVKADFNVEDVGIRINENTVILERDRLVTSRRGIVERQVKSTEFSSICFDHTFESDADDGQTMILYGSQNSGKTDSLFCHLESLVKGLDGFVGLKAIRQDETGFKSLLMTGIIDEE